MKIKIQKSNTPQKLNNGLHWQPKPNIKKKQQSCVMIYCQDPHTQLLVMFLVLPCCCNMTQPFLCIIIKTIACIPSNKTPMFPFTNYSPKMKCCFCNKDKMFSKLTNHLADKHTLNKWGSSSSQTKCLCKHTLLI